MVNKRKNYMAYELTKRKDAYSPPIEQQLQTIFDRFERRFGEKPAAFFIGPVFDEHGQTLVKSGEVWIEIPVRTRTFTTAY